MKLSKRLQAIYDMVPSGVVADVGSDHGKLIISLFENGVITKGYAIENKKGPYDRLVKAIDEANATGITPMLYQLLQVFLDDYHQVHSEVLRLFLLCQLSLLRWNQVPL